MGNRIRTLVAPAKRAASLSMAVLLAVSMLFYGAPFALVGGALQGSAPSVAAAFAEELGQQRLWTDQIDSMLGSGEYVEGEVVAIVAPTAAYAGSAAVSVASADALVGAAAGEDGLLGNDRYGADGLAAPDLLLDGADTEELALATGDAYESAFNEALPEAALEGTQVVAAAESGTDELPAVQSSDVELYTLLVKQEGLTTEGILRELASDPRVVWAEPNYTGSFCETDSASVDLDGAGSTGDEIEGVTTVPSTIASTDQLDDGSSFQWGYADNSGKAAAPYGSLHEEGFDVNLPGWDDAAQTNSAGVIAIVDSGIDHDNPDLAGVMFDMSPYMASIGGDEYGFNASGDGGDSGDVNESGHGTHCAGIAAAAWNGYGISGAANGAKLISVRIGSSENRWTTDSAVKAFSYIGRAVDAGVDIRVANASWGVHQTRAFYLATERLGQKGVAVVFASGNDARSVDGYIEGSRIQGESDCVIVVNSAAMTGAASDFTNYSNTATDVFAPGSTILSTAVIHGDHVTSRFLPNLIKDKESLAAYSDFSQGSTEVEAWTGVYQVTGGNVTKDKVGTVQQTVGFDSGNGVLKITKEELNRANAASPDKNIAVSLKLPVDNDKLANLSNAAVSVALSNGAADDILGAAALLLEAKDSTGAAVMVGKNAGNTVLEYGWNPISVSTEEALSEAGDGAQLAVRTDDDGGKYIWLSLVIETESLNKTSADGILIDCVGAGSQLAPYQYMSGTSMAAPCVTGLAAVASSQMDGYDGLDRSVRAAALTSVLKSSVTQYDAFAGMCSSNGMIDASKFSGTDEDRAPTITSATLSSDEEAISIKGDSLGDGAGSVKISGKAATVRSWSENEVVVERPEGLVSGYLTFELARADGKSCGYAQTIVFSKNVSEDEVPVYEEAIETPDYLDDSSSFNVITALDGSLYVFGACELANDEIDSSNPQSEALRYNRVWRYEISSGTWFEVASLPCRLSYASCTLWDGKLLVMGAAASKDYSGLATKKLFSYDPAADKWSDFSDKVASDEVPHQASLVNVGDRLLLIGGSVATELPQTAAVAEEQGVWVPSGYDVDTAKRALGSDAALMTLTRDNVREFDLDAGSAAVVGSCTARANAGSVRSWTEIQTALCGNRLYLYGGSMASVMPNEANSFYDVACSEMDCLTLGGDGSIATEDIGSLGDDDGFFPAILSGFELVSGLAATADGPVLAGLVSVTGFNKDGTATSDIIQDDTFLLSDGATAFESIGKRVNYTPTVYDCAIAYRGMLYVLGHDFDNGYETVMRATAVATNELPGDVPSGGSSGSGDPTADGKNALAKTGDATAPVAAVALAAGSVAAVAARRAYRKGVARK